MSGERKTRKVNKQNTKKKIPRHKPIIVNEELVEHKLNANQFENRRCWC